MVESDVKFLCKPSLRRALAIAMAYAGLVAIGRYETDLNPEYNPVWLAMFALLILSLVYAVLRRAAISYFVTDDGVVAIGGILARRTEAVQFERIANAAVRQSFLERLLGLSSIYFDSAGSPRPEVVFFRISNSDGKQVMKLVREAMSARKEAEDGPRGAHGKAA